MTAVVLADAGTRAERIAAERTLAAITAHRQVIKAELDLNAIDPYPFATRYELASAIAAALLERNLLPAAWGSRMTEPTREPARGNSLRNDRP